MRTRDAIKRLRELAGAIRVCGSEPSTYTDLSDSIRRTLRLIELCPWIVDGDVVEQIVAKVEKKAKEPAKTGGQ